MTSEFTKTEDEAIELKEMFDSQSRDVFCPMINGDCNIACPCYVKSSYRRRTVQEHSQNFLVQSGYCDNAMFFRE